MKRWKAALASLRAALERHLAGPEPPARFSERLVAAIERDDGVLLRVAALERSLGASGRRSLKPLDQE